MESLQQQSSSENFTDDEESQAQISSSATTTSPTLTTEEFHHRLNFPIPQRNLSFSVENILAPGRFGNQLQAHHLAGYEDGKLSNLKFVEIQIAYML